MGYQNVSTSDQGACIQSRAERVQTFVSSLAPITMRKLAMLTLTVVMAFQLNGCAEALEPIKAIEHLDLSRYMGRWYVIGVIPTRLERDSHNAVETYALDRKGKVCTWYRYRPGSFKEPVKLVRSTGLVVPDTGSAEWKVRFFGPLKAQYKVGWIAEDYNQVLVVRDARDYLWYMARTPSVPESDYTAMRDRAEALGYDTRKVERVPQQWPETGTDNDVFDGDCA